MVLRPKGLLPLVFLLAVLPAQAREMNTWIEIGAEYTDNSLLVPTGESKDYLYTPRLRVDYMIDNSLLELNLDYEARWTEYDRNTFEDRLDLTGVGDLRITILDRYLFWNAGLNRSRVTLDARDADTPLNETERSVFQTGPEFRLGFGQLAFLTVTADYVETSFDQDQLFETTQGRYGITFIRRLSDALNVTLGAQYIDVSSDEVQLEYEGERYTVGLSGGGERFRYDLTAGRNTIDRNDGSEVAGGFYSARLDLTLRQATWWVASTRELTDSNLGLALNSSPGDALDNGDANAGARDIVDRRRSEIGLRYELSRSEIRVGATVDEQDFQSLFRDQETYSAFLVLTYNLSPRLRVSLQNDFLDSTFQTSDVLERTFDESRHVLQFEYRPNDRMTFTLWGRYRDRSSDDDPLENFDEVGGGITVSFRI